MKKRLGIILAFLTCNALAQTPLTDNELRKLFIIVGYSAISTVNNYGGVVLYKSFFDIYGNACSLKKFYKNTSIFIDQEGGSVVRISSANTPSPLQSKSLSSNDFYKNVESSAQIIKQHCVDGNLAPFVESSKYTNRSYGPDTKTVIDKASLFSTAMQSQGVKTVLKHFPAWNENCKSMYELDSLNIKLRPNSEILSCSFPGGSKELFAQKISAFKSVPSNAIMVSNIVVPELSEYPSTMNPKMRDIIRNDLGYKKVIVSDALWEIEPSPRVVLKVLKVVDWVMIGEAEDAEKAIPEIRKAIENGTFTESEMREKIKLIDEFKHQD
jgi:beta-N-acetylhexosaminidase